MSATANDVIVQAWNGVLFDKFTRFKHLLVDGLASFQKSYDTLIAGLAKKTKALGRDLVASR